MNQHMSVVPSYKKHGQSGISSVVIFRMTRHHPDIVRANTIYTIKSLIKSYTINLRQNKLIAY
jgi:hypothetical protein